MKRRSFRISASLSAQWESAGHWGAMTMASACAVLAWAMASQNALQIVPPVAYPVEEEDHRPPLLPAGAASLGQIEHIGVNLLRPPNQVQPALLRPNPRPGVSGLDRHRGRAVPPGVGDLGYPPSASAGQMIGQRGKLRALGNSLHPGQQRFQGGHPFTPPAIASLV